MTTKSMNGTAHHPHDEPRVSDLDLMLYLDGELDAERHEQVRRAIAESSVLRSKLVALELSSNVVQEQAAAVATNIDFADAIMTQIAAGKIAAIDPRDAAPAPKAIDLSSIDIAPVRLDKLGKKSGPSNDNARGIFALAAFAVAAAAGLMIWTRVAPSMSTAPSAPIAMVTTQETAHVVAQAAPEPAADTNSAPVAEAAEGQEEAGVEVAAVDFGSKVGTIFYVPTDEATSKHTTTVVWLADSDGEEK